MIRHNIALNLRWDCELELNDPEMFCRFLNGIEKSMYSIRQKS